ncbi:amino acid adenylation domain-containing protein [Actinoplanes sp. TFC3]|uniref:amino acid adenylation domain-containing protein n=1 Tax=Actinoplanes sp. TFC3 TaxID=1710355 RepID=UPI00191C6624|nr:amino acid adenylation domain-containing protein [Actinoplanes sp. TFC3]
MFHRHARSGPERIALTCGPQEWTYGRLDAEANRFAHYLGTRGIAAGDVIGICLDRSPEMVACVLGTLKAGAAYVPLDTTYPAERLRLMVSQVPSIKLIMVSADTAAMTTGSTAEVLDVDRLWPLLDRLPEDAPAPVADSDSPCYVVFTSGSTGTPKATAVRHRGWFNLLSWLVEDFSLGPDSSGLLLSPAGFDISQRALMAPLFAGATLHLLPSRHFDPMMAYRVIEQRRVRTLHCAPSALYLLLEGVGAAGADALDSLDFAFPGGEPIVADRVAGWATRPGGTTLVNVYGVAECTDVSTAHVLADYRSYATTGVPIGRPISNVDVYLLADDLHPVAPGEVGELCIAGAGLGAGYLNDPGMTGDRFVPVRVGQQIVDLYRTGDLARLREDGELMFVGRADSQVKIRGMRTDLGDVEAALTGNRYVSQAVVLPSRDGGQVTGLVAFVVPAGNGAFDPHMVRRDLQAVLPKHMIPAQFVPVGDFPLSPNGKVDRLALALRVSES